MKYFHLYQTKIFKENFYIVVTIERKNGKIDKQKVYFERNVSSNANNIPLFNSEDVVKVNVETSQFSEYVYLETSEAKIYTNEQVDYRLSNGINKRYKSLHYGEVLENSNKLFVTFPAFVSLSSKIQYPVTVFKAIQNTNKLIFEDSALINGNYLTLDDFGNSIEYDVISVIKNFIEKHNIPEENIIFFGTSKGGSIAIRYGSHFPKASILAISPQLNLKYFFKDRYIFGNFHRNILVPFFDNYKYDYCKHYDFKRIFKTIETNQQKLVIYGGTADPYSYNVLNKYTKEFNKSHNQVINEMQNDYQMKIQNFIDNGIFECEVENPDLKEINTDMKYLHFKFSYKEKVNASQVYIYSNDKLIYTLHLPAGDAELDGQFLNIVIPHSQEPQANIKFRANFESLNWEIYTSNEPEYSENVKLRNEKVITEKVDGVDLFYHQNNEPKEVNKILFTFPGFLYHYKSDQYTLYSLQNIKDDDILKIAYQDRYFVQGTYLTLDDNGNEILPSLVTHIEQMMAKYNIRECDLIFFGASKGGTIAARLIPYFPDAKFIITVPQKNIEIYREVRADANDLLLQYLDLSDFDWRKELDVTNNLKLLNQKSLLVEATNDHSSNLSEFKNKKYPSLYTNKAHNQVTKLTENYWNTLITKDIISYNAEFQFQKFEVHDNKLNFTASIGKEKEIIGENSQFIESYIEFYDLDNNMLCVVPINNNISEDYIDTFSINDSEEYINDFSEYLNVDNVVPVIKVIVNKDGERSVIKGYVYKNGLVTLLNIATGDVCLIDKLNSDL